MTPEDQSGAWMNDILIPPGNITLTKKYPSAHGGFADVWAGLWNGDGGLCEVCDIDVRPPRSAYVN